MNRIERPTFDDYDALQALSDNHLLASYPHLQAYVAAISEGYDQYVAAEGDAFAIAAVPLSEAVEGFLKAHYGDPPTCLPHIGGMRKRGAARPCPMCGSSSLGGTLDHVLPKAEYACFSIFAQNLVPACGCNTRRLNQVTGTAPGARILHPYFDEILSERLIAAQFNELGQVPIVTVRVVLNPAHALHNAVLFHLTNVVMRTSIVEWLEIEWSKLLLKPGNQISDLRRANPATPAELSASIEEERTIADESTGSKNSWQSAFFSGLLDPHVIAWLFARLSDPAREVNGAVLAEVSAD